MRKFPTLVEFLTSKSSNITTDSTAEFEGYDTIGVGASKWQHNGITGQTPSQSPAQLGDGFLNDGNGNQWALVVQGNVIAEQLGVASESSAILNAAQKYAFDNSLGPVELTLSSYEINSTCIIKDHTGYFSNLGHSSCVIKLQNSSNVDMFQTEGFLTQTLQNLWLTSTGVLTGFTMKGFRLDGNKDNNLTSGFGVRVYGKRFNFSDLYVFNCREDGIYTECGAIGGQANPWDDAPESFINEVWVKSCGGNGLTYNGPHDGRIGVLHSFINDGTGVYFGELSNTYSGACDVDFMHIYANLVGCVTDARVTMDYLQVESNYTEGYINNNADVSITQLRAFKNQRNGALATDISVNLVQKTKIAIAHVRTDNGGIGIKVSGFKSSINSADIDGESAGSIGMLIDASQVRAGFSCVDFDQPSSVGFQFTDSTNRSGCNIDFLTQSCTTHYKVGSAGNSSNKISGTTVTAVGEIAVSGSTPNSTEEITILSSGDTNKKTKQKGVRSILTGTSSIVITHNLLYTPTGEDLSLTPTSGLQGASNLFINTITATTFTVNSDVNVAANTFFGWSADVGK